MTEMALSPRVVTRGIPVRERACMMGSMLAINAYRVKRTALKQRLSEGGYQLDETPHFVVCRRVEAPTTIVVHWFAPEAIDADIGHYFLQELKPLGLLTRTQDFGEMFGAVVCSLVPQDAQAALHLYATNTLQHYHDLLSSRAVHPLRNSPIGVFSTLYRRVFDLLIGESFLDAGCSFGFLPLLVAERCPTFDQVVGIDIQTEPFSVMRALSEERQIKQVQFVQGDLLSEDVCKRGCFDTVTLLHVLEHFTEADMYCVLSNLLQMTTRRLIIAVPYEKDVPEAAYGHEQLFSRAKLEAVGAWCLEQWGGDGQMCYEECADGLLVLER